MKAVCVKCYTLRLMTIAGGDMDKKLIAAAIFLLSAHGALAAMTVDKVVEEMGDSGLEFERPTRMQPRDYGMAPYLCDGARFLIPSLGRDSGGRVFVCKNKADRNALADYYRKLGKTSAIAFSWVFVKGNVVLQLNGNLDEKTAKEYGSSIP